MSNAIGSSRESNPSRRIGHLRKDHVAGIYFMGIELGIIVN